MYGRRKGKKSVSGQTTQKRIGRSLLLGTGVVATAAVGYLLNRKRKHRIKDEKPVEQTPGEERVLSQQNGSASAVLDDSKEKTKAAHATK